MTEAEFNEASDAPLPEEEISAWLDRLQQAGRTTTLADSQHFCNYVPAYKIDALFEAIRDIQKSVPQHFRRRADEEMGNCVAAFAAVFTSADERARLERLTSTVNLEATGGARDALQ